MRAYLRLLEPFESSESNGDVGQETRPPPYRSVMPSSIATELAAQQSPPISQLLPVARVSALPPGLPKPTNYLHVERDRAIAEDFVVDPNLQIPAHLLPPSGSDGDKKNLNLITAEAVNTGIWLIGNEQEYGDRKVKSPVLLAVKSGKGCTITVVRHKFRLILSKWLT
jgi:hypothetical protein